AVEVHERRGTSNPDDDLAFDLELSSTVCRPCVTATSFDADRGTYLRAGSSSPKGGDSAIEIDGSPVKNGLLSWDVAALPPDAQILHAEIEVFVEDDTSSSFRIYSLVKSWDAGSAHFTRATSGPPTELWNTPGAMDAEDDHDGDRPLGIVRLPDSDVLGSIVLNVAGRAQVEAWLADPSSNHGILIPGDDGQGGLDLTSDEDLQKPPRLKVVYASACGQ
ncbi:MAG: DNRLRE domain-containing protein, partial [Acidobacteriota bacterium]